VPQEKIILASASPRRRELLTEMNVPFEVITANVTELNSVSSPNLDPISIASENAWLKTKAVAASNPGRWVLGADTVVMLDNRDLGKPASFDEAKSFLTALSGRVHEVITACVLIEPAGKAHRFHDITRVTFQTLTPEVIDRYLDAVHVLDKAGAYALQERGDWIIERVEGSSSNVIGLPTEKLAELFHQEGLL